MHRPNLNNVAASERELLAGLLLEYITPGVLAEHTNPAIHENPVLFLTFHRNYIRGLENFLTARDYPQFVPLPAWDPSTPIPPEFNIPDSGPGRLRNLNPGVSFFPDFAPENLARFATVEELGAALMPRHNLVHARIGGVMNNLRRAPEAPVFWPFHAFIDDIYWTWERL